MNAMVDRSLLCRPMARRLLAGVLPMVLKSTVSRRMAVLSCGRLCIRVYVESCMYPTDMVPLP